MEQQQSSHKKSYFFLIGLILGLSILFGTIFFLNKDGKITLKNEGSNLLSIFSRAGQVNSSNSPIKIIQVNELSNDSFNRDGTTAYKTIGPITLMQNPEVIYASGTKTINGTEYSTGIAELRLNASASYSLTSNFNLSQIEIQIRTLGDVNKYIDAELFRYVNLTGYKIITNKTSIGALNFTPYLPFNVTENVTIETCERVKGQDECTNTTSEQNVTIYFHNISFIYIGEGPLSSYDLKSGEKYYIKFIFEKGFNDIYDVVFKYGSFNITLPKPVINSSYPSIRFISPTPPNNNNTNNTFLTINFSVETNTTSTIRDLTLNFNGTNYTLFNSSLLRYYTFDNISAIGENETKLVDISSNVVNATCSGSGCPSFNTSGKYLNTRDFNGTSNYYTTSNFINSKGSLAVWLRPYFGYSDGCGASRTVVYYANDGHSFILEYNGCSGIRSYHINYRGSYGSTREVYGIPYNANSEMQKWTHVVFTWDNDTAIKLYVDGKLHGTDTGTSGAWGKTDNLDIGFGNSLYWKGLIDDFMVYNRVLTPEEVNQSYYTSLSKINSTDWTLTINQSKRPEVGLDNGNYTYQGFIINNAGLLNLTEQRLVCIGNGQCSAGGGGGGGGNASCTYTSGTWNITCSENCVLTENKNLAGQNITTLGTGIININANITDVDALINYSPNQCFIHVNKNQGGSIKLI